MATERFKVTGDELLAKVRKLIHEGNIRTVRIIRDEKVIMELPLTVGASAATLTILMAPVLAALGALAALITECTIEVEKVEDTK